MRTQGQSAVVVFIILVFAAAVSLFVAISVRADSFTWLTGDALVESISDPGPITNCSKQKVRVGNVNGEEMETCVYQAKGWRYAEYSKWTSNGFLDESLMISFGEDKAMYRVQNLGVPRNMSYVFNSNNLIYYYGDRETLIVKDLPSKITKHQIVNAGLPITEYQLQPNAYEPLLKDENGSNALLGARGISKNGKWMAVEVLRGGLARVNLETMQVRFYSTYRPQYNVGSNPVMEFSVSDDGRFIVLGGLNVSPIVSDLEGSCGITDTLVRASWRNDPDNEVLPNPCPARDIHVLINPQFDNRLRYITSLRLSDDGGELVARGYYLPSTSTSPFVNKWFKLAAHSYAPPTRLDYLALGDSYSSGEGDTELNPATGKKYYRYGTDIEENRATNQPREKCHVSTRSYPYLLAQGMDLALDAPKQWDTVACSGALTRDIIPEDRVTDRGQDSRLAGFDDIANLKATALNEMIPGRVKQIEFVDKYKPKVITLTMGGNDVGFAGKLSKCASEATTCDTVNDRREDMASEIRGLFDNLKDLYETLYAASDSKAKIYVLGYPKFINGDGAAACESNVAGLNASEREMINESIVYLNNVIEHAAKAAGVKYIDIENSLEGHRLCDDGKKYVTGVADPTNLSDNRQESFHPNAKGHFEMAMSLWDRVNHESLLDYDICPGEEGNICKDLTATKENIEVPMYFQNLDSNKNIHHKEMTAFDQFVDTTIDVSIGAYTLAGNFMTTIIAHSDPVTLGQFMTNSDGSLSARVPIPSTLPVGYHTLILQGQTYSGEPVEYEQTILVKGSNPNDIDSDGIADNEDKCLFVVPANADIDRDSIDDACDPEIGEPPLPQEPYRIRAGIPSNNEQANALYLERNIHATILTGISGDTDPDNDGWAVIATNQTFSQLTPYAKFWVDGPDGAKLPHISFRSKENGCVQYKPTNLSKVTPEELATTPPVVRTFTQEAVDTNTCRSNSSEADTDNNGQPDNTQPLYRARNGNPTISHVRPNGSTFFEDPKQLYLERSTRAAEAQLGKSDYAAKSATAPILIDPTDTQDYRENWSIVAASNNPIYLPVPLYKKIQTFNSQLYVLATTSTNPFFTQCSAYKPQNLATIGQTTQYARLLQLDFMQTLNVQLGGCNG